MGFIAQKGRGTAVIAAHAPIVCLIAALRTVTVEPVIGAGGTAAHTLILCLITPLQPVTELPVIGAGVSSAHTGIGILITLRTVTELSIIGTGKGRDGAEHALFGTGLHHHEITPDQTRSYGIVAAGVNNSIDKSPSGVTNPDADLLAHLTAVPPGKGKGVAGNNPPLK
jgi:hypothetical protein